MSAYFVRTPSWLTWTQTIRNKKKIQIKLSHVNKSMVYAGQFWD